MNVSSSLLNNTYGRALRVPRQRLCGVSKSSRQCDVCCRGDLVRVKGKGEKWWNGLCWTLPHAWSVGEPPAVEEL